MSSGGDTALSDLVAQCLALIEDGVETIPFDEICAEHPHLEAEVKESVRMATQLPEMHLSGPGVDGRIRSVIADRYMVRERVGSGAMGVVYAATDLDLGREVALKVMQTGIVQHATALARFEREASALAAVQHESIVTIFDRGITEDGMSFLVMELVEGVPCSDILEMARERGSVDDDSAWLTEKCGITGLAEASFLRQVMRWTAEVASGLAAAHAAGVVHRDVKPSNIIIRPDGRAVLLDFGIAAKEDQDKLTQTGATVGTPAYMAPEALMGKPEAQPSQDVYGLAATLYHFLTLEAPYRGGAHEVLSAIATREPTPAVKVRPGLPRDAQAILDHGLARDPASRYASLGAMESDIRALLDYRPVSVRPTGSATRAWRRIKRSRMAIGAMAAAVLLTGAYGIGEWRTHTTEIRKERGEDAWPRTPANLGIVKASNRIIRDAELRAKVRSSLNDLVDSNHTPEIALNLRAAFLLDHGEAAAALADIQSIGRLFRSAYVDELQIRYERLDVGAARSSALDLSDMPEPTTAVGTYLAAYHCLRANGEFQRGKKYLTSELLDDNRHVLEIRLLLEAAPLNSLRLDRKHLEVADRAKVICAKGDALMLSSGFKGATALQAMAAARLNEGAYASCIELSQQLLSLSPVSHVALQNVAKACFHLTRFDQGLEAINSALRITPNYLVLHQIKSKLQQGKKDFDAARATTLAAPYDLVKNGRSYRSQRLAIIDAEEALHVRKSDPQHAQKLGQEALAHCEHITSNAEAKSLTKQRIRAILSEDRDDYFRLLLQELLDQPRSIELAQAVMREWPETLGPEEVSALREWMNHRIEERTGASVDHSSSTK